MQNSCQIFDFLKQDVKMGLMSGGEWSVEARIHKSRVKGQQKANPSQFSHQNKWLLNCNKGLPSGFL